MIVIIVIGRAIDRAPYVIGFIIINEWMDDDGQRETYSTELRICEERERTNGLCCIAMWVRKREESEDCDPRLFYVFKIKEVNCFSYTFHKSKGKHTNNKRTIIITNIYVRGCHQPFNLNHLTKSRVEWAKNGNMFWSPRYMIVSGKMNIPCTHPRRSWTW